MQVDAKLSENDLSKVKLGGMASFTVESFPNQAFAGEVIQIGQTPRTVQNVMTYDAVISAPNPDLLLEPGTAMAITIMVDRRDNVLRAPDQALRYSPGRLKADPIALPDGSSRLWFLRNGKLTAIAVQLGLDDSTYTEIVKRCPGSLHMRRRRIALAESLEILRGGLSAKSFVRPVVVESVGEGVDERL